LVVEALRRLKEAMPIPLNGITTDNGSEFMNEALIAHCHEADIEFTRSRPYRKNDQAWVEQKNSSVVRRLIGYERLEGMVATQALSRLYASSRLFVNFFQPSFKLLEKTRVGARVKKTYDRPKTPCNRLIASGTLTPRAADALAAVLPTLDPLRLLDEIRAMQRHLASQGSGRRVHVPPEQNSDLAAYLAGLATAWKRGEPRPIH
jgi:hypothetical protein